ncbi:MAG: TolC family protein [Planctomycetia bacterium]|nr:TolC family protein [Planctomycetia bacterium]
MKRQARQVLVSVTLLSMLVTGCSPTRPFYFFDDGNLSHYKGAATEIEYPDVQTTMLEDVAQALPPLTVANNDPREIWDLTLEEAMQNSMANSKVLRTLGGTPVTSSNIQVASLNNARLLLGADNASTVYNPALRESDPRFGTEAALSAFDAQLSSSLFWNHNDRPINLRQDLQVFSRSVFMQDTAAFTGQISKIAADGSTFYARQGTNYEWNNNPSNQFPSIYTATLEAEFKHPLLQGAGVDFNRIAGPNSTSGVYTGVVIARINTDIALADFEAGIRNLVNDVENAYWNLYFAYRRLDANVVGRDSSLQTWRKVHAMAQAGSADAAQEAQAREQYFLFRGNVEAALSDMYSAESALRYLMGLSASDGRLIRPADEPTTAKVDFEWAGVHQEALGRSAELRRQRWVIKRREMELIASKNFLLPRLDADAIYRFRGLGDDLISANGGGKGPFNNAWQSLLGGNYQEWQMGFNFNMPLGFRQALAGVRNAQLQLARERAVLDDMELEVSHLLAEAIRFQDRTYMLSQTNFNRRAAAIRQVQAVQQNYEVGRITLDQLLDAQRRLADAESSYFQSLSDYNRAIAAVHYRKGSLLEYNAVHLAEGPWASKAYFDAEERARARDAGLFMNYGFTRPGVFSQGPIAQEQDGGNFINGETVEGVEEGTIINDGSAGPQVPTIAPAQEGGSLPMVVPPSTIPPSLTPPAIPSPAPAGKAPGPKALPMGRSEGRSASYDMNEYGTPKLRDSGRTFSTAGGELQQEPSVSDHPTELLESRTRNESRKSRTAAGIDRSFTSGPRLER